MTCNDTRLRWFRAMAFIGLLSLAALTQAALPATLPTKTKTLKLGFIWPITDRNETTNQLYNTADGIIATRIMQAAVAHVNSRSDILPDAEIQLVIKDSQQSKAQAISAAYAASNAKIFAAVGPMYTTQAIYSTLVTGGYGIPNCLTDVGAEQFEDRSQYANTFRFQQPVSTFARRLIDFVRLMGYTKIAWVYSNLDLGVSFGPSLVSTCQKYGISIVMQQGFNADGTLDDKELASVVQSLKTSKIRVVVVTAYEDETTALWLKAHEAGVYTQDTMWITSNGVIDFATGGYAVDYAGQSINDKLGYDVANNVGVYMETMDSANASSPGYQEFVALYNASLSPAEAADPLIGPQYALEDRLWDCSMALFYGFHDLIQSNPSLSTSMLVDPDYTEPMTGMWDMKPFTNVSIFSTGRQGMIGRYLFENGDFQDAKIILQVQTGGEINEASDGYPVVAEFVGGGNESHFYPDQLLFFGGSKEIPTQLPPPELYNPSWKSAQGIALVAIAALLLLTHIGFMVTTYTYRQRAVIKRAAWKSLVMIAAGLAVVDISSFLYVGTMRRGTCVAQPFFLNIGFGLVFSNLMAKTWRVYRIFNNRKMMGAAISDNQLMAFTAAITAVEATLSILWVAISTPVPTQIYLDDYHAVVACVSPNTQVQNGMTAICIVFNGLLLATTTVLSYQNRHVVSEYNETKWIGLSVYNLVAVSALFIPLVYTTTFASFAYLLRSIAILLGTGVTGFCIFGPKLLILLRAQAKKPAAQASTHSRAAMGVNVGKLVTQSRDSLANRELPPTNTRRVQALSLHHVPVLLTGTSVFSLNFIARWRIANVTAVPGCLNVEFLEETPGAPSSKIQAFRTENAICRNGTTTIGARSGEALSESSDMEKVVAAGDNTVTIVVSTLDGVLELSLAAGVALELAKHIQGTLPQGPTTKQTSSYLSEKPLREGAQGPGQVKSQSKV
ncbi:Gamma-aminobutyric acid type B receptor subunit 2 [Geranomyces variabilis]|nr:Gamma-aminobutyric acid type B receptor subunit 2 [Geranomyces variabilis]